MKTKNIHIGSIIKQKFEESPLTIIEFAQSICCDRTTVYDLFKRKSIDVDRLMLISEILKYNFLWEVYLKDNPVMIYSTLGCFRIDATGEDPDKLTSPGYINLCLKIEK